MNPHFFTAPFYFAFIGFKVQGSGFRVLVAASPPFLEDVILVSQPSPRGEGAPKWRIGHWRYGREWGKRRSVSFMKATERLIYLRRSRHLHSSFAQSFYPP
ncbi:MAG: hypothetical protein EGQ38_01865 [Dialister sp.]|nr:hypothetical protein [Dialister sp.]